MATNSQQWVLFGIDLYGLWQDYIAAWREVFWQQGSSMRAAIDEPVQVLSLSNNELTREVAGASASGSQSAAFLLPADMVLDREIRLPKSAHANLAEVVSAEVVASSPFGPDDTAFGWRILENNAAVVIVALVIVSKSTAMGLIHSDERLALPNLEVWASVNDQYIVLDGFGEQARNSRYLHRLKRLALMLGITLLAACLFFVTPVVYKMQQLKAVEEAYQEVRREAGNIGALRGGLAKKNALIMNLNQELAERVPPQEALSTLTYYLADDVWLTGYKQEGAVVEIQGAASNGAAMMQYLSQQPEFERVRAVSAFRKLGSKDQERFQIELTYAKPPGGSK